LAVWKLFIGQLDGCWFASGSFDGQVVLLGEFLIGTLEPNW